MWALNRFKDEDLKSYVQDLRDCALVKGLVFRYPSLKNDGIVAHGPVTLFPTPFPKRLYEECLDLQPTISTLMLKIANDDSFIEETLEGIVKVDDFTRQLLDINRFVQKEGLAQPIISCINRSDYMLDKYVENGVDSLRIRQVEVNAIASGMSSHSHHTALIHRYLLNKHDIKPSQGLNVIEPDSNSLNLVSQGLIDAFDAYGKLDSLILFLIEDQCFNFSDHVAIELAICEKRPNIKIVRLKFPDLADCIKLGPNKELIFDSNEIAVVYFRYGYDPSNYQGDKDWKTRLLLERSRAIKCPSINFHLSGAKKFQQVLNNQEQLERFLDSSSAERLSKLFCKFWPLDIETVTGQRGFKIGLETPDNFVLKPQREGGGHNIFGSEVKPFLEGIENSEMRSQYILMERINCASVKNWLLTYDIKDNIKIGYQDDIVSELGIFGSILGEDNCVRTNRAAGYLVRSKKVGVNEGGVASGHAGLSSLRLIELGEDGSKFSQIYS